MHIKMSYAVAYPGFQHGGGRAPTGYLGRGLGAPSPEIFLVFLVENTVFWRILCD